MNGMHSTENSAISANRMCECFEALSLPVATRRTYRAERPLGSFVFEARPEMGRFQGAEPARREPFSG